jgi:hypothetical protein
MEPPKTPEELAELERAIADMLEGREHRPQWTGLADLFARMGCALRPAVASSRVGLRET